MSQIDPRIIEELRNTPIEGVAARLGIKVRNHKCLCPFHGDKNPSGSFKNNRFRCFSCGATADVIKFTQQVQNVGFKEAVRFLSDESNVIIREYTPAARPRPAYPPDVEYLSGLVSRPQLNAEAEKFLFEERKYNPAVVRWLGISSISTPTACWRWGKAFYDAPSLLIPYRSVDGKVQNVQSRYLGTDPTKKRFKFPANSSIHIFNLPILRGLQMGQDLWLAEGPSDTMAHLSDGHACLGIPSATMLKTSDLSILKPFVQDRQIRLHFAPDNDAPGKQLASDLYQACQRLGLPLDIHPLPDGVKDYSEWYSRQHESSCVVAK